MKGRRLRKGRYRSLRQELLEKGEQFSKKELLGCYCGVFLITILLGVGMKLGIWYLLAGTLLSVLQVPGIYINYRKRVYEKRRFDNANAYMAHMVQTFAENGKILQSLKETRDIFARGTMRQSLTKAISHIENAFDVELAEQEALGEITARYDCERIRTLHDFLLRAEQRGGSCAEEFRLLESIRQLWEQTVLKHNKALSMARNLVTFEYFLLVIVCIFMLYQFPKELAIIHLPLVQVLNTFLIVVFFFLFSRMDRKQSKGLLEDARRMSEQQAEKKLAYLRKFRKKSPLFQTIGYWRYMIVRWQVRTEIKQAFPCWLFDVLLLLQSENVSVALGKSAEKAPAILKGELKRLSRELEENPMSAEVFLSFLYEFQIPEVEGIMRKLYALSNGTGISQEVMNLIMNMNLSMLAETERQRLHMKGDLLSVYYMLPTLPIMICMVGYGVALMFVIFQNIMTII